MTIPKRVLNTYMENSIEYQAKLHNKRVSEASEFMKKAKEGSLKQFKKAGKVIGGATLGALLLFAPVKSKADMLTGHVYSALDKTPVPGLIVKLNGNQTLTDANGFYTISKDVGINDRYTKVQRLESKIIGENPINGTGNITLPYSNSVLKIYNTTGQEKSITSSLDPGMYLINIDNSIGKLVVTSPSKININYSKGSGSVSSNAKASKTLAADNVLTVDDEEIVGTIGNWFQYQDSLKTNPSNLDIMMIPNPDTSVFKTTYHRNLLGFVNQIQDEGNLTPNQEGDYGLRNYEQDTMEVYLDTTKVPSPYYTYAFLKFIEDINSNRERKAKRVFTQPIGNNAIIFDCWSQSSSATIRGPPLSVCYISNDAWNTSRSAVTRVLTHEGAHAYIPFNKHSGDDDFVTHGMGNTLLDPYYRYTFDPFEYVTMNVIDNLPFNIKVNKKYKEE